MRFGNQKSHLALASTNQGCLVVERPRVGLYVFKSHLQIQMVWTTGKLFN